jgi:hypothetical protein
MMKREEEFRILKSFEKKKRIKRALDRILVKNRNGERIKCKSE